MYNLVRNLYCVCRFFDVWALVCIAYIQHIHSCVVCLVFSCELRVLCRCDCRVLSVHM